MKQIIGMPFISILSIPYIPAATSWNRVLDKYDNFQNFPLVREFQVSLLCLTEPTTFPYPVAYYFNLHLNCNLFFFLRREKKLTYVNHGVCVSSLSTQNSLL